ncbi:excalibur calcium-binding domain-containing protein [Kribbella sp. NBC_00359]|uniref:excalibur calcium-binding domain-containing protein n=1 Tax=Kribbella sp. NBC_00359 TaxID=2975966 RepID=UPI002E22185F
MRQFNAPPGWPDPPTARWRPPKRWQPKESWPPAPDGWAFWVDENGHAVRGPLGRFGGTSRIKVGAIAAIPLALIALVLFNPFTGGESASTAPTRAATTEAGTTPVPGSTPTAPQTEAPTTAPTSAPTHEPTLTPTETPTPTQTPSPTPTPTQPSEPAPTLTESVPTTEPAAPQVTTTTVVYKNCAEVRAAGKAPLHRGDPGYSTELDRNGDGVACDRGNS